MAAALAGLLLAPEASAQGVKPSTTAPKANQPTAGSTTTSSTGKSVPSINIVAPNSAGVSHNIYNQFNVGPNGLILNNATQAGQSQIGGQLGANPNFTGGHYASLILNEVTGGSASSLQGYIEIFGHSADFILANPAGVTCNGCGFINTPRVTLTTGTPNLDANGGLSGFTVGGSGQISIEGTVNITGVQYFDVAARSIFVGGEISDSAMQAEVGLFAGRNNFDYNARTATALADDGSAKPAFGIDASAGSIKAGKIAAAKAPRRALARAPATCRRARAALPSPRTASSSSPARRSRRARFPPSRSRAIFRSGASSGRRPRSIFGRAATSACSPRCRPGRWAT